MIDENGQIADRIRNYVDARIACVIQANKTERDHNARLTLCEQFIKRLDYNVRNYVGQHGTLPPEIRGRKNMRYVREVMEIIMGADLANEMDRLHHIQIQATKNSGKFYEKEGLPDEW